MYRRRYNRSDAEQVKQELRDVDTGPLTIYGAGDDVVIQTSKDVPKSEWDAADQAAGVTPTRVLESKEFSDASREVYLRALADGKHEKALAALYEALTGESVQSGSDRLNVSLSVPWKGDLL